MLKQLTALAAAEAVAAGRRKATQLIIYVVAAVFAVAAVAFALGGLHTLLAMDYGQVAASFIMAGGLFALALIIFVAGKLWRPRRSVGEALATAAIAAGPAVGRLAPKGAAQGAALVGSLALGALLGRKLTQ